jgi:ORF57
LKIDTTKVEAVLMDKTVSAYRLAKDTGISQSTITRLRNKERLFKNITVETLIKVQTWIDKNGK